MKHQFISLHLDFVGFSTSILCAIHCAFLPFLLSIIPLAGFQVFKNPWIEYSIIFLSFIIASFALLRGYYKHHKKPSLLTALFGFLLISLGHLFESTWQGILILTLGAMVIALAHYLNWKHLKEFSDYYPNSMINGDSGVASSK